MVLYPSDDLYPSEDLFPEEEPALPPGAGRATVTRLGGYQLLVAETTTGHVVAELPFTDLSWDCPINGIGGMAATIPIDASTVDRDMWDDRDPRSVLRSVLRSEWKMSFVVVYDRNPIWAGPLVTSQPVTGDWTVRVGCLELPALLDRRRLLTPGFELTPGLVGADTDIGPTTLWNIAAQLFAQAIAGGAGYELPLVIPEVGTVGSERRYYYGADLASYWDRLLELIAVPDGPDIRCDPVLTYDPDTGDRLSWRIRIGQPHLGAPDPWVWDDQVNQRQVSVDRDASKMTLRVFTPGQEWPQERDREFDTGERLKPIGVAQDASLAALGFPILDVKNSDHAESFVQGTLDLYSAGYVQAFSRPTEVWKVVVAVDGSPKLGEWRVGDTAWFDMRDQLMLDDGVYQRRIVGANGRGLDHVELTLAPVPAQLEV